ncbi:protein KINESIN LIGHT CHAIN-RELATED 2-like [Silene latifolia]|uniref:protein KINESIN LIGHT CHAIN-RELATED 2-like n=1 Tax=Silene latifolia TaxID=37657 RepID=UPI003D76AC8D
MKRLSVRLISSSKPTISSTSISGIFTQQFTTCSSSSSISESLIQNLKPCSNSNGLFSKPYKTHQFHKTPSHNYSTHVKITPYNHSEQSEIEKKRALIQEAVKAAKAAKSPEEMLEAFEKDMEDKFDKDELGAACLNIGLNLEKEGEDPQKILSFAHKSLAILDNAVKKCSFSIAMTLQILGFIYCKLRKFNDALGFLNRANKILVKLENDGNYEYGVKSVKDVLLAVQLDLVDVHIGMRSMEALDYLRKSVETKGFLKGKDSKEFGDANWEFAGACVGSQKFKDGLPYCLKALEIHLRLLGENSVEVAHDRQLLGAIYAGLEEYEKALEENWLAQKVFRICGCTEDVIDAAIDAANMLITCGRYEAAVKMLKEHEKGVEENSENPLFLMTMAKALVYQKNFADAKGCLENACRVLDKKEKSKPLEVADAYIKIADLYEKIDEVEASIFLLLRTLALLEKLPEKGHLERGALSRMGSLLLMTDKATQAMAIPYLERAVETVKESYGSKHFGVGYMYNDLGKAYLVLKRPESAAEIFVVAKDILDSSLGPHHKESINTCQNLSNAYAAMKSYPLAIEFQQKAVDAWEGHGHSAEDKLREARRLLEQLKVSARGASSKDCPEKALPLPHSSDASGGLQAPQPSSPKKSV